MIVTFVFIPELNGLELKEGDKRWLAIVSVRARGKEGFTRHKPLQGLPHEGGGS